jgi:hypothetical protein
VKTGYQPGRQSLLKQADKDNWLLNHGGGANPYAIGGGAWWFLPSRITTLSGSSASFYQRLSNDGINILLFIYRRGKGTNYNNISAENYAMWYATMTQDTRRVHRTTTSPWPVPTQDHSCQFWAGDPLRTPRRITDSALPRVVAARLV